MVMKMMKNEEDKSKEVIVVDPKLKSTLTKKIVRYERENAIQKERTDSQMEEIIKHYIEGEVK